ncbi:Clp protease N-terminal domain-containing protein [Micromonospora haikouensis]|uniref:Clp protease N-terminal domain-containing protein n=1 Tax=Micromonospora haikouensis TaxID=686309 RepID=UPI0037AAD8B3
MRPHLPRQARTAGPIPATERSGRRPGRGRYRAAGRRHIGTEHILLGLLREGGGPSVCRYKERPAGWPPRRRPFPLLCTHRRNGVRKVVGRALLAPRDSGTSAAPGRCCGRGCRAKGAVGVG